MIHFWLMDALSWHYRAFSTSIGITDGQDRGPSRPPGKVN